jgi:hypothetical protein
VKRASAEIRWRVGCGADGGKYTETSVPDWARLENLKLRERKPKDEEDSSSSLRPCFLSCSLFPHRPALVPSLTFARPQCLLTQNLLFLAFFRSNCPSVRALSLPTVGRLLSFIHVHLGNCIFVQSPTLLPTLPTHRGSSRNILFVILIHLVFIVLFSGGSR